MIRSNCLRWELASGLPHDSEAWLGFDLCWGGLARLDFQPLSVSLHLRLGIWEGAEVTSILLDVESRIYSRSAAYFSWMGGWGWQQWLCGKSIWSLGFSLWGNSVAIDSSTDIFFFLFLHVWDWSLQVSTGRALLSSSLLRYYVLAYFGE